MIPSYKKGFTLIELLVVIAIIGVLSSIVLSSLNSARTRANDAKIKTQLSGARTAAALYHEFNNNYGPVVSGNISQTAGTSIGTGCAVAGSMFVDSRLTPYTLTANYPAVVGGLGKCTSTGSNYTITANLSAANSFWCVDNAGNSKLLNALPADNAISC